jgi:Protein of unknown function (DUF2785)
MMKHVLVGLAMALLGACATSPAQIVSSDCPPMGWDIAGLGTLKNADFEIADAGDRGALATTITGCLDDARPEVRDGIAFEALAHMLRAKQLDDVTKRSLLVDLSARLNASDPLGVGQSFAALALSEVARADRIESFLTQAERAKLLVEALHWFINISDYRGFDETEGWRHAVAHGSDLLMQLALNPKVDEEGLRVIISAVGVQAVQSETAYTHGEPERLARPILFAAARGAMSEQEWTDWLKTIATPPDKAKVFSSRAGLNWRSNVMGFLQALYVNVVVGSDPKDDVMRPGLEAALKVMP